MRRLWYGNFDFEASLAGGGRLSHALARLNAELASVWAAVAAEGDCVWTPQPIEPAFFERLADAGLPRLTAVTDVENLSEPLTLVPWGWTEATHRISGRLSNVSPASLPEAARRVNARSFSANLETEWNCGLEKSASVRSLDELRAALGQFAPDEAWVVKAEWGNAARERIRGCGPQADEALFAWAGKRLARDGRLHLEPWVDRLDEIGIQLEIRDDAPTDIVGLVPLRTDPGGRYLGSRIGQDLPVSAEKDWEPALETAERAATRIAEAGYVGPLGIDAMCYRDEAGAVRVRPLQDINARWTMGRLALGFGRLLGPRDAADWHHVRWHRDAAGWQNAIALQLPHTVRMLVTSPANVGNEQTDYGTALMISDDLEALAAAGDLILRH